VSNFLSIAAVTTTLQSILFQSVTSDPDLSDTTVTILPLDKARGNVTNNQLNLFLYHITRNQAWSNRDMPGQVKPGETAFPPLPLNLYYLLTAFGRENDATQAFGHELLGKAMLTLHDHALLKPDDIRNATAAGFPRSDLDRQIERVRITFQPLTLDELSKLWTGFAMQLRLSAAYEISVALIESSHPVKTPLPALTRGRADSGVRSAANLTPPFPTIESIELPNRQPSALLNDVIVLRGHDLDGTNVRVSFKHPLGTGPIEIPVVPGPDATAAAVRVHLPNSPSAWPAGMYTAQVSVQRPTDSYSRSSNEMPFSLAPSMTLSPASAPAGSITYTAVVVPDVLSDQRAGLLFGSQEIPADPHSAQTNNLTFQAKDAIAGDYFVRLRVDGVDSLLVDRSLTPPVFNLSQKVTVV
jgi:hypothetical protein